jgi:hypothetical protein
VVGALATAALGLLVWSVNADVRGGRGEQVGKDVVVTGRVIDLHCFMTGQMPSSDPVRCTTDCIRAGVPAALESDTGLFVLGQGVTGPAKTLLPFAYAEVEISGKVFERNGVRYLDIASIKPAMPGEEGDDQPQDDDDGDE